MKEVTEIKTMNYDRYEEHCESAKALGMNVVELGKYDDLSLAEDEFNGIMQFDVIDVHFRRAFLFYYMTGCRKAEPFKADLNGNWLTIKSADAKAHRTREVQLNPILKGIVTEMQDRFHMLMDEYGQKPRHIINRYGKEFKKACRQLGIKGKTLTQS